MKNRINPIILLCGTIALLCLFSMFVPIVAPHYPATLYHPSNADSYRTGDNLSRLVKEIIADDDHGIIDTTDPEHIALLYHNHYHTSLPTGSSQINSSDRFNWPPYSAARSLRLR